MAPTRRQKVPLRFLVVCICACACACALLLWDRSKPTPGSAASNSSERRRIIITKSNGPAATTTHRHIGSIIGQNEDAVESCHLASKQDFGHTVYVLEEHKLVFFPTAKVGSSVWKMLFRRMLGYEDWNVQKVKQVHKSDTNGLLKIHLDQYSDETIRHMLESKDWTRAIFVRDPIERFFSAWKDKSRSGYLKNRCKQKLGRDCVSYAYKTPEGFLEMVNKWFPNDVHWRPQSKRLPSQCWDSIHFDFVGRFDKKNLASDAERLLRRVGAWEKYGKSGWGDGGTAPIFSTQATLGRKHGTDAQKSSTQSLTPELLSKLLDFYQEDYRHPLFNLTLPEKL